MRPSIHIDEFVNLFGPSAAYYRTLINQYSLSFEYTHQPFVRIEYMRNLPLSMNSTIYALY
jgi:hypothetical protein